MTDRKDKRKKVRLMANQIMAQLRAPYLATSTRWSWCIPCKNRGHDRFQLVFMKHVFQVPASNRWKVMSTNTFDSNLKLVKKISRKYSRSDFGALDGIVILFLSRYERTVLSLDQAHSLSTQIQMRTVATTNATWLYVRACARS